MVTTQPTQHVPLPQARNEEDYENRREHPRIPEPPLHVSGLGLVRDVSMGGMSVFLEGPCRCGEKYEVILTDATVFHTKSLMAEVVWAAGRTAGLKWVDLSDDQKRWLAARFHEWSRPFETTWVQPVRTRNTVWKVGANYAAVEAR